ncbi:hypothetical protein JCGZ_12815 [Jatropha curcas]|uniref:Uncharacterized protein n=1 Tax=Jatropha curcas TaxID=180498 RepID=A0A067KDK3_JATCU|nr:hypothetical protein JCGZ_12815 [Jatropha curcas]
MDGRFVHSSEHSSPCLSIEPFEHKGKTYPGLEIFADVIDIVALEPKELKSEEEKEQKEEEKRGLKGCKWRGGKGKEEEQEKGQSIQVKEEEDNKKKASTNKEEEDTVEQVLKAIRACIEEGFEEAEAPTDVIISVRDEADCNELSMLFNEMNFNFAYLFDVFLDGSIHRVEKHMCIFDINS